MHLGPQAAHLMAFIGGGELAGLLVAGGQAIRERTIAFFKQNLA